MPGIAGAVLVARAGDLVARFLEGLGHLPGCSGNCRSVDRRAKGTPLAG